MLYQAPCCATFERVADGDAQAAAPRQQSLTLQLNAHLLPPLTFTHTPHPSAPIRGSPPIATRHIQHPRSGREHLILTFWVHGRGIGEEESLGWARRGYHTAIGWARGLGEWAGLVTESRSDSATEDGALRPTGSGIAVKAEETSGAGGWLGGLLGGMSLRGSQGTRREKGLPPPGTYTVGEVHGDYVKVSHAYMNSWVTQGTLEKMMQC